MALPLQGDDGLWIYSEGDALGYDGGGFQPQGQNSEIGPECFRDRRVSPRRFQGKGGTRLGRSFAPSVFTAFRRDKPVLPTLVTG
jgi:hypothetical protein